MVQKPECLRPRERFWDIQVPKIDSAFDNLFVPRPPRSLALRDNIASSLPLRSSCRATDTTAYADVLLPAQGWGEKDGTVTSSERRISRQHRFLAPAGMARPDWWIICQVAKRLGFAGFDYAGPEQIFSEYAQLSGYENNGERHFDISGLAEMTAAEYDNLHPVQWPVPAGMREGTARLFTDHRFFTPSRRAKFIAITPRPPGHFISQTYPLVLNTGRVRDQWHTMTRTGKSPRLFGHDHEPFVELHPADARGQDITRGELVRITSRWGEVVVRGRINEAQAAGPALHPHALERSVRQQCMRGQGSQSGS